MLDKKRKLIIIFNLLTLKPSAMLKVSWLVILFKFKQLQNNIEVLKFILKKIKMTSSSGTGMENLRNIHKRRYAKREEGGWTFGDRST